MRTLLAFCVLASSAHAADPLLVEFGWHHRDPVTLPANYLLSGTGGPWYAAVASYPMTMTADAARLETFNFINQGTASGHGAILGFAVTDANGAYQQCCGTEVGRQSIEYILGGLDRIWENGNGGLDNPTWNGYFTAAAYIPQLTDKYGHGIQRYEVTRLDWEIVDDAMNVSLWGHLRTNIPEPSACVLLFVAACHISSLRSRSRNRHTRRWCRGG